MVSFIPFIIALVAGSSFPRELSKTGKTLCPKGSGNQEYGYVQTSPLHRYFYTIIQADGNPKTAPTFLFCAGGPGSSSLASLLAVTGPCRINGNSLINNKFSWTRQANGIWVDAPIPAGFSEGPLTQGWENLILDLVDFVKKLFEQHEDLNRDVHLVGLSASASMLATLGARLVKSVGFKVNLVGVMIVSGVVSPLAIYRGSLQMAQDHNLLPSAEIDKMKAGLVQCEKQLAECNRNGPGRTPISVYCNRARMTCNRNTNRRLSAAGTSFYDIRAPPGEEETFYRVFPGSVRGFLNQQSVQQALGVSKKWIWRNTQVRNRFLGFAAYDTTYEVTSLLDAGLKVLVVNGDQDFATSAVGAFDWVSTLKGVEDYGRLLKEAPVQDMKVDGRNFGKMRASQYPNGAKLAFIKVLDAGHTISLDDPSGMQSISENFFTGGYW